MLYIRRKGMEWGYWLGGIWAAAELIYLVQRCCSKISRTDAEEAADREVWLHNMHPELGPPSDLAMATTEGMAEWKIQKRTVTAFGKQIIINDKRPG